MRKRFFILSIASIVVILDFITKILVEKYVQKYEVIEVLPFLNFIHVKNPGVAFGFLQGTNNYIFIFISLIAIGFIFFYMSIIPKGLELFSLSLILGGAAGNLIDRFRIGEVIDFIDFYIGYWHWFTFNIADSSITVGIVLLLLAHIAQWRRQGDNNS